MSHNPLDDSQSAYAQMIAETRFAESADGAGITDEQLAEVSRVVPDDELMFMAVRAGAAARAKPHRSGLPPSAIAYMRGVAHGVLAAQLDERRRETKAEFHPPPERE